jgi:hypothetical protein
VVEAARRDDDQLWVPLAHHFPRSRVRGSASIAEHVVAAGELNHFGIQWPAA